MKLFRVKTQAADRFEKYHGFHVGQLVRQSEKSDGAYSGTYWNARLNDQLVPDSCLVPVKCTKQNLRKFAKDKRRMNW